MIFNYSLIFLKLLQSIKSIVYQRLYPILGLQNIMIFCPDMK